MRSASTGHSPVQDNQGQCEQGHQLRHQNSLGVYSIHLGCELTSVSLTCQFCTFQKAFLLQLQLYSPQMDYLHTAILGEGRKGT